MAPLPPDRSSVLDLTGTSPPLRWGEVFGVPVVRVEVELGSGKGMFLRRASAENTASGFLGVERAGKFFGKCAERFARDGMPNARLVRADAYDLLSRWIPPGSIHALHIYFPDPWPKKRHAKRRMLSLPLFDLAARAIAPGGFLAIASDVEWYFAQAVEQLRIHSSFDPIAVSPLDLAQVATHYAVKYEKEGRRLQLARFLRNASAAPAHRPQTSSPPGDADRAPSPSPEAAP